MTVATAPVWLLAHLDPDARIYTWARPDRFGDAHERMTGTLAEARSDAAKLADLNGTPYSAAVVIGAVHDADPLDAVFLIPDDWRPGVPAPSGTRYTVTIDSTGSAESLDRFLMVALHRAFGAGGAHVVRHDPDGGALRLVFDAVANDGESTGRAVTYEPVTP